MTPETRRALASLVAGMAAMLVGLVVRQQLLQEPGASSARATRVGIVAGIAVAVVLWRTFTFFAGRRR